MSPYYQKYNAKRIKKRDHFSCVYCGSGENLTIDHVIPKSRARDYHLRPREINKPSNLVTACESCNKAKQNITIESFLSESPTRKRNFLRRAKYLNNRIKSLIN